MKFLRQHKTKLKYGKVKFNQQND